MRRPLLLVLLVALFSATCVSAVLGILAPAPAPVVAMRKPASGRLSRHLLFVVVDGLRYDVATDAQRMPEFARAMASHQSAEIWAGAISMTTSAILAYGTGQPGRLEQIVRNVSPKPPPYNSWLENAKASGLRIGVVGDPAWAQMYGPAIALQRLDPPGVAIDVDFNALTFAGVRELHRLAPDVLIAHFVTPDHQGHAYGIYSERYTRHIRQYDAALAELLREFGPEWTVLVTSDHGAADTGTHGTDTPVQRRSPIYAYGPGIAERASVSPALDQLDLAGTFAALLGIAAPAHGRGHVLSSWLAVSDDERARIACADAERMLDFAHALTGPSAIAEGRAGAAPCKSNVAPAARLHAAADAVRRARHEIETASGWFASGASSYALIAAALMVCAALYALGKRALRGLPAAVALLIVALGLVFSVERLPGDAPNAVRIVVFVLTDLGVLLFLLWPGRVARVLEPRPVLASVCIVGLLAVSYTANTQPHAYVAVVVSAVLFLLLGAIDENSDALIRSTGLRVSRARALAVFAAVLLLFSPGAWQTDTYSRLVVARPWAAYGLAALVLCGFVLGNRVAARTPWRMLLIELAVVLGALGLRPWASPLVGRACIVAFGIGALLLARRGVVQSALAFGLASFTWVARPFEIPAVVATIVIAQAVGRALRPSAGKPPERGVVHLLVATVFVFGLTYIQRIAIQGSIELGAMDWGSAAFGDPRVSAIVVGTALVYKYVLAQLLVFLAFFAGLDQRARESIAQAGIAAYAVRSLALLLMLLFCGQSFWTAFKVLGDLPFGLIGSLSAALSLAFVCAVRRDAPAV